MFTHKKDPRSGEALGTGRRKTSVARVRVRDGNGTITVNGRTFDDYFPTLQDQGLINAPLNAVGKRDSLDIVINVEGGGPTGQAGACVMGLARALVSYNAELYNTLRDGDFLTRDSRMKERKKYGLRGARRGVQFSKR